MLKLSSLGYDFPPFASIQSDPVLALSASVRAITMPLPKPAVGDLSRLAQALWWTRIKIGSAMCSHEVAESLQPAAPVVKPGIWPPRIGAGPMAR